MHVKLIAAPARVIFDLCHVAFSAGPRGLRIHVNLIGARVIFDLCQISLSAGTANSCKMYSVTIFHLCQVQNEIDPTMERKINFCRPMCQPATHKTQYFTLRQSAICRGRGEVPRHWSWASPTGMT